MHRTKKITVMAIAATLLMAGGVSSAQAARGDRVTICHRTNSDSNPYVMITVSERAVDGEGRNDHTHHVVDENHERADIIPAPAGGCPGGTDPDPGDGHGCSATSSTSNSTGNQTGLVNVGNVNVGLDNLLANLLCQANVLNGPAISVIGDAIGGITGSGSGDGCTADSSTENSTGDQTGLVNLGNVNVGLGNTAANVLCQANVLNGPAISVIGDAIGGFTGASGSDDSCTADSVTVNDTGDQVGLVNLGNLNVDAGNAAANLLCQASVLNGPAISVIGDAFGGFTGASGSDDSCTADSVTVNSTGDEYGLVNLGNLNVDAGNLAANALCQASVLDGGLAVSVIGDALGGSALGTGFLSGPLGLLSGAPGYLLSGITTDIDVLASVLLQF